jgi:hypothetical protein
LGCVLHWCESFQALGHEAEQSIELGELVGRQDGERVTQPLPTRPGDLGKQSNALVTEPALDDTPVVGAVDSDHETSPLDPIDELGCRSVGDADEVGELADRDRARLPQREEQPQLTEGQVVAGPGRRPVRKELPESLNMRLDLIDGVVMP